MKLTAPRAGLLQALAAVTGAAARKDDIPILAAVHIAATPTGVTLATGNLEIFATSIMPGATIDEPGDAIVNAAALDGFVKKITGEMVRLERRAGALTISAGRARLTLPAAFDAADIPPPPRCADPATLTIPTPDLARLLDQTRHAISTEKTRFYLNGVYLHSDKGVLAAAATDGHRLAFAQSAAAEFNERGHAFAGIMPRAAAAEIRKACEGVAGDARLSIDGGVFEAEIGDVRLGGKLIDGTFPEYKRVIPKRPKHVVTLDRAALKTALERVLVVSNERSNAARLKIEATTMEVRVNNPDRGDAAEEIDAANAAAPIETGFNGKLLLDALSQSSADKVELAIGDPQAPALFSAPGDETALAVVMPLRV